MTYASAQQAVEMMTNWRLAHRILMNNEGMLRKKDWFFRESNRYDCHPAVLAALKAERPYNWQQLLLEWPHQSVNDAARVAYTRDERGGEEDRQTVTSIGKYLRRHWPDMADHTIRDLVARFGTNAAYKLVSTSAEMIHHLHQGPGSCMVWSREGVRCTDGQTRHPYETYNPKYGWKLAVGVLGGETISRALVVDTESEKYFVRTYLKPTDGGYSQVDGGMEHWLQEQGFTKEFSWKEGQTMSWFSTSDHFLAPYLDGNRKTVRETIDQGGHTVLVIDDDGDYELNQTSGEPNYHGDDDDYFSCEDCGDRTENDDGYWVTRAEDEHVCRSCLENNYTLVYGRRSNQYYVNSNYAVYCNDEYYDEDYLEDNSIVQLNNSDYEHTDNAVEIDGDWYHVDDEDICYTDDTSEYSLCADCWQCTESGNWYTDDCEDYVMLGDDKYHNDHIPAWVQAELDAQEGDDDEAVAETASPVTAELTRVPGTLEVVWAPIIQPTFETTPF